jgi:hypothetical protein
LVQVWYLSFMFEENLVKMKEQLTT